MLMAAHCSPDAFAIFKTLSRPIGQFSPKPPSQSLEEVSIVRAAHRVFVCACQR
jgi:hypothetical protein